MAIITDYATLKTEVANYLARSDLTSDVPRFIQAGEERIYNEVRAREMETAFSGTISSGVVALPSGFIEFRHLYIDNSDAIALQPMDIAELYRQYPTRSADDEPCFYAIAAGNVEFGPYPDSAYTVKGVYYKRLDPLSDSNTDNWLTDTYPNLILYASLTEAAAFLKDAEGAAGFDALYERHKERLHTLQRRATYSGGTLRTRAS